MNSKILSIAFFCLLYMPVQASSSTGLFVNLEEQEETLETAVAEAKKLLSPLFKQEYLKVKVVWRNLEEVPQGAPCNKKGGTFRAAEMVKINFLSFENTISINRNLLASIGICGKYFIDKFVLRQIIHEIAHFIDYTGHGRFKAFCQQESQDTDCATRPGGYISGRSRYRELALGYKSISLRTLNQREMTSVEEHFAINFESFILDREMRYRRPFLYHVFAEIFGYHPFSQSHGVENFPGFFFETGHYFEMSAEQVVDIQYVYVNPGSGIQTLWGHSMFLITYCRAQTSECPVSEQAQLVASYRAFVENGEMGNFKSLIGHYYSTVFFYTLDEIKNEYEIVASRKIDTFRIKFSDYEKKQFVRLIFEKFWDRIDTYFLLQNNCAHESYRQIKSVLPFVNKFHSESGLTPQNLLDSLRRSGLVSEDVQPALSKEKVTSESPEQKSVSSLRELGINLTVESYSQMPPNVRRDLLARNPENDVNLRKKIAGGLYVLEMGLMKPVIDTYVSENPVEYHGWGYDLSYRLKKSDEFGIPLVSEVDDRDFLIRAIAKNSKANMEIFQGELRKPALNLLLKDIKDNLRFFQRQLLGR